MTFEQSQADGPHAVLAAMEGGFTGSARLRFEPDVLHGQEPVTGTVELLHGGRFAQHRYATPIDGTDHTGQALIGCELDRDLWQVAWIDSFHTGTAMVVLEGPAGTDLATIGVLGRYHVPNTEPWGWRTTFEPGEDALVVCHFNVSPRGEESLAVRFDYARA